MNRPSKNVQLVLLFPVMIMFKNSLAQKSYDSLQSSSINSIDVKFLVGFWETTDSLKTKIEFIDSSLFKIVLDLRNNSHPYFFIKDGQNKVSTVGFFINWPPFSCDLHLIEPETLEISFSQLGVPTYFKRYKKIRQF